MDITLDECATRSVRYFQVARNDAGELLGQSLGSLTSVVAYSETA
jgi:hypothetical protein